MASVERNSAELLLFLVLAKEVARLFSLYWLCWSILDISNGCVELSKRSFPAFGKLRFYLDGLMFDTTDLIDSLMFAFEAILSIIYFLVWRYGLQELFLYLTWIMASLYSRLLLYFLMAGLEKSRSQDALIGSYMFEWLLKCCAIDFSVYLEAENLS